MFDCSPRRCSAGCAPSGRQALKFDRGNNRRYQRRSAGALRLTAPAFLINSPRESAIWQVASRYPNVAVTLYGSDEQINLIAEGFDMAIRLGPCPTVV